MLLGSTRRCWSYCCKFGQRQFCTFTIVRFPPLPSLSLMSHFNNFILGPAALRLQCRKRTSTLQMSKLGILWVSHMTSILAETSHPTPKSIGTDLTLFGMMFYIWNTLIGERLANSKLNHWGIGPSMQWGRSLKSLLEVEKWILSILILGILLTMLFIKQLYAFSFLPWEQN